MPFTYKTYIDYPDTDAGGVVFHSRYIEIAHRARSALLQEIGTGNIAMQQDGYSFMVKKLEIEYHGAAGLDDLIVVESRAVSIKGARINMQQCFYKQTESSNRQHLTTIDITLAFVSTNGRPLRVPQWFQQKLSNNCPLKLAA